LSATQKEVIPSPIRAQVHPQDNSLSPVFSGGEKI
jgi:hypothetical protein